MKKILLLTAIAVLITTNCKSSREESVVNPVNQAEESPADIHNAKNSLDYLGIYKGILPCADCEGIETEITLNPDESYQIKTKYLGKDDKVFEFEDVGSYDWMEDGNRLIFEDVDSNISFYLVAENKLVMLDRDGNKISGALAKNYELIK